MKKLMSLLLVAIFVLSCFAGCAEEETAATTAPAAAENTGPAVLTNEDMYGHIDQTVPVDGVYKIWNVEGVKNIANHPCEIFVSNMLGYLAVGGDFSFRNC